MNGNLFAKFGKELFSIIINITNNNLYVYKLIYFHKLNKNAIFKNDIIDNNKANNYNMLQINPIIYHL